MKLGSLLRSRLGSAASRCGWTCTAIFDVEVKLRLPRLWTLDLQQVKKNFLVRVKINGRNFHREININPWHDKTNIGESEVYIRSDTDKTWKSNNMNTSTCINKERPLGLRWVVALLYASQIRFCGTSQNRNASSLLLPYNHCIRTGHIQDDHGY